jgi:hypothetical protein
MIVLSNQLADVHMRSTLKMSSEFFSVIIPLDISLSVLRI